MPLRSLVSLALAAAACGPGQGFFETDAGTVADAGNGGDASDAPPPVFEVTFDAATDAIELTDRFVSFTVDVDRLLVNDDGVIGIDFTDPRLRALARNLAPALMRIGGTKADMAYYDLSDEPIDVAPAPYGHLLRKSVWDAACDFATDLGFEIAFTLNAGDGPRNADGHWTPDAARALIEHSTAHGCPMAAWELGNEVSAFAAVGVGSVNTEQYAADFVAARTLIDEVDPDVRLAGPASAYFPLWGEATLMDGFLPSFVQRAGDAIDIVTWHYYPTQSDLSELHPRPASLDTLLDPETLDEVVQWALEVEGARDRDTPAAEVWLGETASALIGGQEGLSDRFGAGLWWLDQLGLLASHGEQVVARQSLTGGRYHLIDADTLEPYPDYFNSLLFRTLMGHRVLRGATSTPIPLTAFDPALVRTYAHCTPDRAGAVTVLALNLSQYGPMSLTFPDAGDEREVYLATADDSLSTQVTLNGTVLTVAEDGTPPAFEPVIATDPVVLPPVSYAFVVLPEANAPACQ